jgi:uncharacterized protein (TIGR03437 family)
MTSLRKFPIVLLVVAALAGILVTPAQAQVTPSCNASSFPSTMSVGITYNLTCTAIGGTTPYTFTLSGTIPTGMTSAQIGGEYLVEGAPTTTGTFSFTIGVVDSGGRTGSSSYTVSVGGSGTGTGTGTITISSFSPTSLTPGSAVTVFLYGSGFSSSSNTVYFNGYSFAGTYQSSGQLYVYIPAGYVPSSGTVPVYLNSGGYNSNTVNIPVGTSGTGGSLSISSLSPTSISTGTAFTLYIFGSGFTAGQLVTFGPYTLGSQFISSSEISVNIPAADVATAQTINVSVAGSNQLQFTVGSGGSTGGLTINCNPSTGPYASGQSYSQFCTVGGGNGSYTWTVSGLPTGLSQNTTVGSSITISGTPTSTPPYNYTISVNDSSGKTGSLSVSATGSGTGSGYTISSLSPSTVGVNSGTQTLIVYGSGFTTSSQVYFNNIVLPTYYQSANQLNATLYSTYLTVPETVSVYVSTGGQASNALTFNVGSGGSTSGVTLSSMSPTAAALNSPAQTLYLYGSGFSSGQLVTFGSASFGTQFINSGELIATIPAQYFTTAGTVNVSVAGSNSLQFNIGAGSTGSLSLSCNPTTGPGSVASFTQTCTVSNGTAPYTWSTSGLPAGLYLNSSTGSQVTITGTPVSTGNYSYSITVVDSSASRLSGSLTFSGSVGSSSYNITSLSPSSVAAGSGQITLTVLGTGFSGNSYVYFNSGQLATQYVSPTQLNAILPANFLTTAQTVTVNVNTSGVYTNSLSFTIGSGSSSGGTLTVVCSPGVGPGTVGTAYSTTCTASGGVQPYNWPTPANLPNYLTYSTTTGPSITISGTPGVVSPYNYTVKVTDSSSPTQSGSLQIAGETSNANSGTGSLLLTSLSPTSAAVNSASVSLVLMGSGFTSSSQVIFNGFPIATQFVNSNELIATVPAGQLTFALSALVTVTTPGVGTSNSLTFVIGNGGSGVQMTITCTPGTGPATPNSYYTSNCGVNGGTGPYNWTIGSGSLPSGLSLNPNGPLATITGYTTFNGVYSYTMQVTDSSSRQNVATLVFAGETGTGTGSTGGLSLSSLSPSSTAVGSAQFTLAVYGSNFASNAQVYFNGAPLSTTYVSAGQLNATVPASSLTVAQTASITVISSGTTSNALTFTVGTVTSTAPMSITCNPTTGPYAPGQNYSSTCTVTGGKSPYTWSSPVGASLPFGLVLTNSNGGPTVTLTGSVQGNYNFTVQVTDSSTTPLTATYPFVGQFAANQVASIFSLSQASAPAGSGPITLVVTGIGFVSGFSTLTFANNAVLTTVNSSNQLTASIPSSLLTSVGTDLIQIIGTTSNTVGFFVVNGGSAGGVSPGSLTFTYGIGGTIPPAQTLNVTNLGGSTNFSAVALGQANGVNWLSLSQTTNTIPGTVSVNVAPGALPVGTYSGTVTLTGFNPGGSSVSIPVTLNVLGAPALTPSTTNVTLTVPAGASASKTINITSSDGTTVIPYNASAQTYNGGNWLSVSPTSGSTPGTFTVTASAANLSPSTYSGIITLASTGGVSSQSTVSVSLVVTAPGAISANPTSLAFTGTIGQSNPAAQTISVSAANNATVNYTVATTTSSGSGWLTATQSGTTPGTINVSAATGSLAAGTYNGTVTITSPGSTNSPLSVPVTFVVSSGPALIGSPTSLSFSYQTGGPTPANQTFTVSAPAGSNSLAYSIAATTSTGGNWLSVTPTSGSTQGTVTVSVNPSGLAVGTYNGNVTATASGVANLVVPVTLTVSATSPTLSISPGSLTFSANVNGSAPASQSLSVSTSNSVTANYTVAASSSGNWLSVSPASGTTPGTVTVSVNQNGLAVGNYTGSVTITSSGATNSPQTVTVTLNVTSPPSITAVPSSLTFTVPPDGSTPPAQSVTVISTGGNTAFTTSAVSQGGNWLSVGSGGTTPASVAVTVNPSGLLAGSYNGSITISAPASNPTSIQVPVTLVVSTQGPATLQVAPTALYLNYSQGAGTDLQHVAVLNGGAGTVNFTAQAQTATCGNWLSVLTPTGSATASSPAVLAFNVNPSGLSMQTCRGSLSLNDGNGNITTVPVYMAISGASQSVLLSQTAMNFAASAGGSVPAAQTFQILNPGSGLMQWNITTQVLSGGSWLSVSPNSGSSQSLSQVGSPISVSVNPQGLAAGVYYGSVIVTSTGAFNGPQMITVVFSVGPQGTNPPESATPNGVVLTATGPQTVTLSNPGGNSVTFASAAITDDGQSWLTVSPTSGTLAAGSTNALTLSASTSGLSSGLRHGTLRIAFSDGNVQTVDVKLALSGSAGTGTGVSGCGSSNLAIEFLTPAQNYSAAANVAIPLQVLVEDCGGNLLTNSSTGVDVLVGSSDLRLNYTGNGIWTGTWIPTSASASTTLTARALEVSGGTTATGVATASVSVAAVGTSSPPAVAAVLNAASYLLPGLVAPGAMVSIFGSNLADGQSSVFSVPFPNSLQGAQFTLRGLPLPLFYASNGQVNAIIPTGLNADERDQLLVVRDTTQSAPVDLVVADVDPGIFATNQQGTGQGAILVGGTAQLAAPAGSVQGAGPATAGQIVSIFLSGLGSVTNPPTDGSPSSASNPSTTTLTPTVTIGGVNATVVYSGLAPGEVGLYQVNVQVPAGVTTGNAVPVVVTIGSGVSNTVTMAIM